MFNKFKKEVSDNFNKLAKSPLFYVAIDRDEIWNQYLAGFPEEFRQENNCNACKSFLRQFGGLVTIKDNKVISLWDNIAVPEEFADAVQNLRDYIHSRPITGIFLNSFAKCGTDKNRDGVRPIVWEHFHIVLPNNFVVKEKDKDTLLGTARDNRNVLKRSLDELTLDATETVLELIAQNSLYRGKESEGLIKEFQKLQKLYKKVLPEDKDNFCWSTYAQLPKSFDGSSALAKIRNTSIGTLLTDLSEGIDLDVAVRKFEDKVSSGTYKRPQGVSTPRMVEAAKKTLSDLGLLESLNRRYANETDISANDVLFKFRPSPITDVFEEISKESLVNPRTFSKIEEINVEDFLEKVVPTAKSISVLLENSHLPNMVSLFTAQDSSTPSLFKWGNLFSWGYTGGITDSIKEKVKLAGGNVDGELRVSLEWHNYDDLDIHIHEPQKGEHIYFSNKVSRTSGHLDVDRNAGSGTTREPVENVIWTNKKNMLEGTYKVRVHNFAQREKTQVGFTVQVEHNGEKFDFEYSKNPSNNAYQDIVEFEYSKTNGIKFKNDVKSNVVSKEKWNLKTNQFHKATMVLLSPNHWMGTPRIGNKHYIFTLENCISDEDSRSIFNEYLKPELEVHRKVFETLGGKLKIESTTNQISGIGFSDTVRNSVVVQVDGKFKRNLRINF